MARMSAEKERARLLRVRRAVVEGGFLRQVLEDEGLRPDFDLGEWLRRRMDYTCWPPSLAQVDAALARVSEVSAPQARCRPARPTPIVRRLVEVAACWLDVPAEDVLGPCRMASLVSARRALIWAMSHAWPRLSRRQIGILLGYGDSASVRYQFERAKFQRPRDGDFAELCDELLFVARAADAPLPWHLRDKLAKKRVADQRAQAVRVAKLAAMEADPDDVMAPALLAPEPVGMDKVAARQLGLSRFCDQCDQLVSTARAAACRDRFCSLRACGKVAA